MPPIRSGELYRFVLSIDMSADGGYPSGGASNDYIKRNNQPVAVIAPNITGSNHTYDVLFVDGWQGVAFSHELKPLDVPLPEC